MASKKKPEAGGILAKVVHMFKMGELDISVESALERVPLCEQFPKRGACPTRCKKIHVDKRGNLRPSVGLHIAWQLERDPASQPGVHVDPVLALQAFLLANRSPLIIDHMYDREKAFVFRFAEQHISPAVHQIARQRFVSVDVDGDLMTLNATDEPAPTLLLHCVQQNSLESSFAILVNGFNYGEASKPYGIYSVDANVRGQSGMIKSYDGGAAIVLKPTGFVVNISDKSSSGNQRSNKNYWLTGAPPGVILFRRMDSKLREFILHRASVQFAYISMEQSLFEPWAREYAVAHPDNLRAAHDMRRDWKARAGVVLPSHDELSITCDSAQTMAGIDPVSRPLLTVAQPRSRSRSPSVPRCTGGGGVEIAPPLDLHAPPDLDRLKRARLFLPEKTDFDMERLWEQTQHEFTFEGGDRLVSEPDRRYFVRSSVGYMSNEFDEMNQGAAASSSGSSLQAARSVLQEYHSVDRAESNADANAAATTATATSSVGSKKKKQNKVQGVQEWPCDGPGCGLMMRSKSEWHKFYRKFYCKLCFDINNVVHPIGNFLGAPPDISSVGCLTGT